MAPALSVIVLQSVTKLHLRHYFGSIFKDGAVLGYKGSKQPICQNFSESMESITKRSKRVHRVPKMSS